MARYKCRGIRGKWTENNMQKALAAVKKGQMKIYTASKHFNIPRRTLKRYLTENKNKKSSLGRKPLLTIEQERELKSRIFRLCNVGYPLTQRTLRSCVKTFCDLNNISTSSGVMIGRDWLRGFLKRHKDISQRKAQNLNPARAQKLNKKVVADYFEKLKKVLEENGLMNSPEKIFNIDEKGCQLNLHSTPQVLAERGTKRVHIVAHEHAESVTIVSCGNALGQAIPPMILFKGKRKKPEWKDLFPDGTNIQMTPKASMTIPTFVEWIHHLANYKLPGPCVVVFDGAKCHLDYSIVEAAEKFDIKLFCLPSNTTHELQPMDKAVFRSFEYYWNEEVLKYFARHEDRKITKIRFATIFSKVWDKAMTPANIKAGFEATGIYPFDPNRIPEEAYAPSLPTHISISEETGNLMSTVSSDSEDDVPLAAFVLKKTNAGGSIGSACSSAGLADKTPVPSAMAVQCSSPCTSIDSYYEYLTPDHINVSSKHNTVTTETISEGTNLDVPVSHPLVCNKDPDITTVTSESISGATNSNVSVLQPSIYKSPGVTTVVSTLEFKEEISDCNDKTKEPSVSMPSTSSKLNVTFSKILKTPQKISSPTATSRKKAINSLAQELTKDSFKKKDATTKDKPTKTNKIQEKTGKEKAKPVHKKPSNESWYCFICQEDRIADMRLCLKCKAYVHEECVGLTAKDKENYICIRCEN